MIRKLKLGLIAWFVCSLLLVSGAVRDEEPAVKPHLVIAEKIWVPDSVYSPDRGIDFDWTVWWWRWENGLTQKKPPYKNMDEAIAADWNFDDYSVYKDLKFIDSTRLPNEPNYFGWQHFSGTHTLTDKGGYAPDAIWILEERVKVDPDSKEGLFVRSRKSGDYYSYNSLYHLVIEGDTLYNFRAIIGVLPVNPTSQHRRWEGGYSFIFQRDDGQKSIHGYSLSSIHAVVNGEDLNERGYVNTLAPAFLDENLFFLFQKDGKWGWNYNGEEHPNIWDRVYYHYGDGESGPAPDPTWKNICALRDGMWYMVRFERIRLER